MCICKVYNQEYNSATRRKMTRLTEEMVVARSKQSDLNLVKKLNCWGSDLTDVSIIKRMRGVEVLALSVNKISTLQPFEDCLKLQELYLRKNNIKDINEIAYLQNLPNLKYLWLEENPCCDRSNYRSIVLRALPNLKKLDNIDVTPEEVDDALKDAGNISNHGQGNLNGAGADEESYEDAYDQHQHKPNEQKQPHYHQAHYQARRSSSPLKELKEQQLQQQASPVNNDECISETNNVTNCSKASTPTQRSPDTDQESSSGVGVLNNNSSVGVSGGNGYRERMPIPPSTSTHSMKEYYQTDRPHYPAHYRHSQSDLTEWDEQHYQQQQQQQQQQHHNNSHLQHNPYGGSTATLHHTPSGIINRRSLGHDNSGLSTDRSNYRSSGVGSRDTTGDFEEERPRARRQEPRFSDVSSTVSANVFNHYNQIHRRPLTRNSNLLSATLCLVKELDYPSLEVVEHAVRCRIDELSNE